MKIYNTLTQKKESLKSPRHGGAVEFFVCGPTVYDHAHLGHARTYIAFDFIVKYLRSRNYKINYIMNITNIDDKIINRAKETKINAFEIADKFEKEFYQDMRQLDISSVSSFERASDYIPEIIAQIKLLLKNNYAYEVLSGVYFDIKKFKNYGKLSRQNLNKLKSGTRIKGEEDKKHPYDFALWKKTKGKPGNYEPFWKSPWGSGRPGWHIEDTAITQKHFGPQYTIHGGALDLIFPHHEAEIAQMEAAYQISPMVKIWMHTGFLNIGGKKMSKSEKNFITIKDFLQKHKPTVLKMLILSTHYRSPIDYSEEVVFDMENSLQRIQNFYDSIKQYAKKNISNSKTIIKQIEKTKKDFYNAMDNDFNTPEAISAIFKFIEFINTQEQKLNAKAIRAIKKFLEEINKIFGILEFLAPKTEIALKNKIRKREESRQKKDWVKADKERKQIEKEFGVLLKDTTEKTIYTINT